MNNCWHEPKDIMAQEHPDDNNTLVTYCTCGKKWYSDMGLALARTEALLKDLTYKDEIIDQLCKTLVWTKKGHTVALFGLDYGSKIVKHLQKDIDYVKIQEGQEYREIRKGLEYVLNTLEDYAELKKLGIGLEIMV